jgi:ribosomal protein S18 acetylase RimI-like enzyme
MTQALRILYARESGLDVAEFRRVLVESGLGASRPIGDEARLRQMLSAAGLIVTARLERSGSSPGSAPAGTLVGVARGITDSSWCCYLSELAVSGSVQGLGVGRGLLDEARRQLGPRVSLILASMPDAVGFYERIGMPRMPNGFWYRREH